MHLRQSTAELQRRIVAIGGLRETLTMQCELKAKREALEAAGDELAREVESKMGDVVREFLVKTDAREWLSGEIVNGIAQFLPDTRNSRAFFVNYKSQSSEAT